MQSRRTARLLLRPYEPGDYDDLYAIESRPDVTRYLYWDMLDGEQVRASLDKKVNETVLEKDGDELTFAVVLPQTGRVIGDVQLNLISNQHRQGEVGYVFHPDHGGHGYATEATRVMLEIGFADVGLHRVIGRLDSRNTASARVLERLGMRREAHFVQNEIVKGEWTDEMVYAILRDEWQSRTP